MSSDVSQMNVKNDIRVSKKEFTKFFSYLSESGWDVRQKESSNGLVSFLVYKPGETTCSLDYVGSVVPTATNTEYYIGIRVPKITPCR